jgi:peptide/nickel transport system substrate-binding protein
MSSNATVTADPFGSELRRRDFMRYAAAAGAAGFASFVDSANDALAADGSVPADKSAAGYTLTAAYAASPPAVDEVAFTMETENMLALCYAGDLMQYKPVQSGSDGIYVADMAAHGDGGVIGRWADKWESTPDAKTWTFHLRPGIKSWAGNEMTSADIVWTWQRAFVMKSSRFFFATVMALEKPENIEVIDKYTFRFHLAQPSPLQLKLMAMSYYGGRSTPPWQSSTQPPATLGQRTG